MSRTAGGMLAARSGACPYSAVRERYWACRSGVRMASTAASLSRCHRETRSRVMAAGGGCPVAFSCCLAQSFTSGPRSMRASSACWPLRQIEAQWWLARHVKSPAPESR
jgi:hypothetical protein